MVTKVVVHFGEDGRNTVTIRPNGTVKGVLFDGQLDLPNVRRTRRVERLDDHVEARVGGRPMPPSGIEEQPGVCYWVEDGPVGELICW